MQNLLTAPPAHIVSAVVVTEPYHLFASALR
jgi:hypothetical protein